VLAKAGLGYTLAYPGVWGGMSMPKVAKLFMNNRSQAVRLPKEFQFKAKEVYIRKEGDEVILSPRPGSWAEYIANREPVSDEFMEIMRTRNDDLLPLREPEFSE
jgi:antitoxin VapB